MNCPFNSPPSRWAFRAYLKLCWKIRFTIYSHVWTKKKKRILTTDNHLLNSYQQISIFGSSSDRENTTCPLWFQLWIFVCESFCFLSNVNSQMRLKMYKKKKKAKEWSLCSFVCVIKTILLASSQVTPGGSVVVPDELKQIHMWTSSNLITAEVLQKSKQFPCDGQSRKINNTTAIDLSVFLLVEGRFSVHLSGTSWCIQVHWEMRRKLKNLHLSGHKLYLKRGTFLFFSNLILLKHKAQLFVITFLFLRYRISNN